MKDWSLITGGGVVERRGNDHIFMCIKTGAGQNVARIKATFSLGYEQENKKFHHPPL